MNGSGKDGKIPTNYGKQKVEGSKREMGNRIIYIYEEKTKKRLQIGIGPGSNRAGPIQVITREKNPTSNQLFREVRRTPTPQTHKLGKRY